MPYKVDTLTKKNRKKVAEAVHKRTMANEQPKKQGKTHIKARKAHKGNDARSRYKERKLAEAVDKELQPLTDSHKIADAVVKVIRRVGARKRYDKKRGRERDSNYSKK